jgi:hypothetical protein
MFGLAATIYLTFKAVKAAQASVDVAQDTAKRQLRAYIAIDEVHVVDLMPGCTPRFACLVNNCGQTPAFRVRTVSVIVISDVAAEQCKIKMGELPKIATSEIGPGQGYAHWAIGKESISKELWQKVADGEIALIFTGLVTYYDAFRRFRRVTFAIFSIRRGPTWTRRGTRTCPSA